MRFSVWCVSVIEILGCDAVYADLQDKDFLITEYRQHFLPNCVYRQTCTVSQPRKRISGPHFNNIIFIFVKFCTMLRWMHVVTLFRVLLIECLCDTLKHTNYTHTHTHTNIYIYIHMTFSNIKILSVLHYVLHLIPRTKSNYSPISTNRIGLQWRDFVLIVR